MSFKLITCPWVIIFIRINYGCVFRTSTLILSSQNTQIPPLNPTASTLSHESKPYFRHILSALSPLIFVSTNPSISDRFFWSISLVDLTNSFEAAPLQFQIIILITNLDSGVVPWEGYGPPLGSCLSLTAS